MAQDRFWVSTEGDETTALYRLSIDRQFHQWREDRWVSVPERYERVTQDGDYDEVDVSTAMGHLAQLRNKLQSM
jgi:hypothetical protein